MEIILHDCTRLMLERGILVAIMMNKDCKLFLDAAQKIVGEHGLISSGSAI